MPCGHHRGMKMPPKRPPRDLFHRKLSVILSGASLRAKSKDPHLVASSAWVADPSQAQDDNSACGGPETYGTLYLASIRGRRAQPGLVASAPCSSRSNAEADQGQDWRVSRSGRLATAG